MDLDILDATIFDGHSVLPADRISIRGGIVTEIGTGAPAQLAERTIEAAGRLVTPGFVDAHVHTTFGGQESLACDLSGCEGLDEAMAAIRAHLDSTADSGEEWVTGGGWSMADFPGGAPRAELLDALGTTRPIMLVSRDHHSAWVNSTAMAVAGLDATTSTPAGGVIEKDPDGTPTGCLHESAMDIVGAHIPPAGDEEILAGLLAGQSYLHRLGVTAWMDAIVGDYSGHRSPYDAYVRAESNGQLCAEVVGSLWWPRGVEDIDAEVARLVELRRTHPEATVPVPSTHPEATVPAAGTHPEATASSPRPGAFRTHSVKFMLDGIIESRTAAMSAEYACACGGFGTSYFTRDHLHRAFAALDAAGFDIHCHAIGDAAVKAALDAFEAIAAVRPDARHHIAHVQVVDPVDIPRFAQLGITANLQALWACRDQQMIDLNLPCLGEERSSWQYPFRSFRDSGARLAMGSDWPVSTADPWEAIHVAVNRSHPHDGDAAPLVPEEAIDILTALRAYTSGSARLLRSSTNGRLRPGTVANLAMASANPFEIDPEKLLDIRTELTIAAGRIVHDALSPETVRPRDPDPAVAPTPDPT
ncbi:amidohydrolase, partial [Brevibacterium celere]